MKIRFIENSVLAGKCVVFSIKTNYRAIHDHPFLVVFVLFSYLLHNLHPRVFSFLLNASPVIICTTLLLGLLLSYGEPLLPEIDETEDEEKTAFLQEHGVREEFVFRRENELLERRNGEGVSGDHSKFSQKVQAAEDVTAIPEDGLRYRRSSLEYDQGRDFTTFSHLKKVDREGTETTVKSGGAEGLHKEQPNEDSHKVDGCVECVPGLFADHSVNIGGVKMDSDTARPDTSSYSHLHSVRSRLSELGDFSDSNSNGAESSSPDASMTDILPMLEEFHPLLNSELSHPVHININDSDDTCEESSEEQGGDYSSEEEVDENQEGEVQEEGEENSKAMMAWTADDLKNVMDLGISEHERNQVLEKLMAKQNTRTNAEAGNLMYLDHGRSLSQMGRYTGLQISPISTRRMDPFDHLTVSNANKDLPPIPSSAPSSLLRRRNPFEFPLPQADNRNIITVDWPIHRQSSGYFSGGPFSAGNLPTNLLQHESTPNETGHDAFQEQMSDSKLSSISESETLSSFVDEEYQEGLVEHDRHQVNAIAKPSKVGAVGKEEITSSSSSEVADEDLHMIAESNSASTLEREVSVQYSLLSKSTDENDERSQVESTGSSALSPLGTSTVDDAVLLEPLLSQNLQHNFETFARQRSKKQVFFQVKESSMEDDLDDDDDDECVHLAKDETESSAPDGNAILLSSEGDVTLAAERTTGDNCQSQKVQQYAAAGLERLEYPEVPAACPEQVQLTFNNDSTDGIDDDENTNDNLVDMNPDDDSAILPSAFTKDDGFIGIYTTHPVKDLDSTFSERKTETFVANSEGGDLSEFQENGSTGDSQGICAGNNESGEVSDCVAEKESLDITQDDQESQLHSNSEEDVLVDNVMSKHDLVVVSEDKTCLVSPVYHSDLPEVEAQSVEDLHVLKQLAEADIDSTNNLSELRASNQSVESFQVDSKLDAALEKSEIASTDLVGEKEHRALDSPFSENLRFPSKNEDEQAAEGLQLEILDRDSHFHEIEAKSHEDIHMAFKRLSEGIADDNSEISGSSESSKTQIDQKVFLSSAETLQKDSGPSASEESTIPNEEGESNLHEVEAQSLEDIHLALKRLFRQSTFKSVSESIDASVELGGSDNQAQPKLQHALRDVEPQTPRDFDVALKRLFRQNTLLLDREDETEDASAEISGSDNQVQPKLPCISSEVVPQTPRDFDVALKRLFRQNTLVLDREDETEDKSAEISASEKQVEANMEMETSFQEVEAQTPDDIHLAMKQFVRQNTISLNEGTSELSSEIGESNGHVEPGLKMHSDVRDVEAKSYDDLHSFQKELSDGAVESSEKEIEFEDASSDFDHTEKHVESDEDIFSVVHEAEAKYADDTSSEKLSPPGRVTGIDIVNAENEPTDTSN